MMRNPCVRSQLAERVDLRRRRREPRVQLAAREVAVRPRLLRDERVEGRAVTDGEAEVHLQLGCGRMRAHVSRGPVGDGQRHLAGQLHVPGRAVLRPALDGLRRSRRTRLRDRRAGDPCRHADAGDSGDRQRDDESPEAAQACHPNPPPSPCVPATADRCSANEYGPFGVRWARHRSVSERRDRAGRRGRARSPTSYSDVRSRNRSRRAV